jgi:hypothetical protein
MSNDGGPVYPQRIQSGMTYTDFPGMSLRDWFAGQALAGIMGPNYDWFTSGSSETGSRAHEAAFFAYAMADAMLAARNPTPTKGE